MAVEVDIFIHISKTFTAVEMDKMICERGTIWQ